MLRIVQLCFSSLSGLMELEGILNVITCPGTGSSSCSYRQHILYLIFWSAVIALNQNHYKTFAVRAIIGEGRRATKCRSSQVTRLFLYAYSVRFIADTVSGGVRNSWVWTSAIPSTNSFPIQIKRGKQNWFPQSLVVKLPPWVVTTLKLTLSSLLVPTPALVSFALKCRQRKLSKCFDKTGQVTCMPPPSLGTSFFTLHTPAS